MKRIEGGHGLLFHHATIMTSFERARPDLSAPEKQRRSFLVRETGYEIGQPPGILGESCSSRPVPRAFSTFLPCHFAGYHLPLFDDCASWRQQCNMPCEG